MKYRGFFNTKTPTKENILISKGKESVIFTSLHLDPVVVFLVYRTRVLYIKENSFAISACDTSYV